MVLIFSSHAGEHSSPLRTSGVMLCIAGAGGRRLPLQDFDGVLGHSRAGGRRLPLQGFDGILGIRRRASVACPYGPRAGVGAQRYIVGRS
jgi:hypothetical protein